MTAPFDLVLRGGEAVLPEQGRVACDIAVKDGCIAAILAPGATCATAVEQRVDGLVVLPGGIDVHLHLGSGADISRPRRPSDAERETAAAAAGGVTCFIPYLMAAEPYDDIFRGIVQVTEAGARIDFGYHFCISTEAQLAAIPGYVHQYGVPTFKLFMNNRGGEGARLGLPDVDDGFLLRLCEAAAAHGGMVCPHPETIELAWITRARALQADPAGDRGLATWNASRPPFVEADAVQRAAYVAKVTGAPLYVVHTSSAEALDAAVRLRAAGARVAIETCPHYLTHDVGWHGGAVGKINPPLREKADREALWAGLLSGVIDTVATDHVHRDIGAKAGGIWQASPGCPGLETLLPVLLSEGFHKRGLPLSAVARLVSGNPARLMGLDHAKGAITPGLDADFAIVDLDATWTVQREDVVSAAGYSIYEGETFRGRVVHTMVRGKWAMQDRVLASDGIGIGRYMPRRLQAGPAAARVSERMVIAAMT